MTSGGMWEQGSATYCELCRDGVVKEAQHACAPQPNHCISGSLPPCCLVPLLLQLADRLNRVAEGLQRSQPLSVLVQVNTSGEETKYGCEPDEVRHATEAYTQWHQRTHKRTQQLRTTFDIHTVVAPQSKCNSTQHTLQTLACCVAAATVQQGCVGSSTASYVPRLLDAILVGNMQQHRLVEQRILMYWFQAAERQVHHP
jgi:hypothetical protein